MMKACPDSDLGVQLAARMAMESIVNRVGPLPRTSINPSKAGKKSASPTGKDNRFRSDKKQYFIYTTMCKTSLENRC